MRALVTGGAGFIGSNLADALLAEGHQVVVLDDLSTGSRENLASTAELVIGDIRDGEDVARAVRGCEVVFHLAALRAVLQSVEHPVETDRANTGGTLNVLEAARNAGVRRVVSASSSSVYGRASTVPTPESAPLLPHSPYTVSKMAGEHYARVFWELYGLETVGLRLFNVYGPRQRPDSRYAAVIPLFIHALRNRIPPEVHGDGLQSRGFAYVSDVVRAFCSAASAPADVCAGRVYNVAGDSQHSLLDLLAILERLLETKAQPRHVDTRQGDIRHSGAELSAAASDLGWRPEIGLIPGLERTVAWFTSHPPTTA